MYVLHNQNAYLLISIFVLGKGRIVKLAISLLGDGNTEITIVAKLW